ncbi:MAG: VCBS repeat-containing protein, partial [Planctomycetota bacterium]
VINPHAAAPIDFDRDGKMDLAVAENGESDNELTFQIAFFRNVSDEDPVTCFERAGGVSHRGAIRYIDTDDLSGDGLPELVLLDVLSNTVSLLTQHGGTEWRVFDRLSIPLGGARSRHRTSVGDLDGDGRKDLVVPSTDGVRVFRVERPGSLTDRGGVEFRLLQRPNEIAAGDFDGDGVSDVAISWFEDDSYVIGIFLQDRTGSFGQETSFRLVSEDLAGFQPQSFMTLESVKAERVSQLLALSRQGGVDVFAARLGTDGESMEWGTSRELADERGPDLRIEVEEGAAPVLIGELISEGGIELALLGASRLTCVRLESIEGAISEVFRANIELSRGSTMAKGNFDDDGIEELIVRARTGELFYFDLAATLEARPLAAMAPPGFGDLAIADLDRDGNLDLVAPGGVVDEIRFLMQVGRSDGVPVFEARSLSPGGRTSSMALGDLNGD